MLEVQLGKREKHQIWYLKPFNWTLSVSAYGEILISCLYVAFFVHRHASVVVMCSQSCVHLCVSVCFHVCLRAGVWAVC